MAYRRKERNRKKTDGFGSCRGCGAGKKRLCDCKNGSRVRLETLEGEKEFRLRMAEMGLTKGSFVDVVKDAPLGDPVEYRIKGYHLTLRRVQTANVLVSEEE